jgi:sugar transferase (PEP-CTERM system associated)
MSFLGRHYNELLRFVPLAEALLLYASVYIGAWLRLADGMAVAVDAEHAVIWPEAALFTGVLLLSMTAMGLYNKRLRERLEGIIIRLVLAFAVGTAVLTGLFYVFTDLFLGRGVLGLSLLVGFAGIVIVRALLGRLLQEPQNLRRIVVLGTGRKAGSILGLRRRTDLIGLRVVGFIPVNGESADIPDDRKLRIEGDLADWAADQGVDEVVVAPDERRQTLDMNGLMSCRAQGIAVTDLNTFLERETGCLRLDCMTPGWFAFSNGLNSPLVSDRVKRLFDVGVSLAVLVVASPLVVGAALAIWLESGRRGPILYRQVRTGRNGRPFEVLKFRSMCTNAESPGEARWAEKNDARITRVGGVLRRFRIDELPQLFNILRGDMSFVGPRPERPEFVESLEQNCPHYADRHRVKPGLTGWAQIRYPYGASEEDAFRKLQYDLYYVKNRSLYLDLVILLQTAEIVLWGHGAR